MERDEEDPLLIATAQLQMKMFAVLFVLAVSLSQVSAQAPGDHSDCTAT